MGGPHPLSNGEIAVARFDVPLYSYTSTDIPPATVPGQKAMISAKLILTSRSNTSLISQNIWNRSTVSLNLALYITVESTVNTYLAAEATRLERVLTNPLETNNQDDLSSDNITPATEATEELRAPKKKPAKQTAKRKSPSKTTAEGMSSQYSVPWSLTEYLRSCWRANWNLSDSP
jgi:hypothetical protein